MLADLIDMHGRRGRSGFDRPRLRFLLAKQT
jgi:hypothetical protein